MLPLRARSEETGLRRFTRLLSMGLLLSTCAMCAAGSQPVDVAAGTDDQGATKEIAETATAGLGPAPRREDGRFTNGIGELSHGSFGGLASVLITSLGHRGLSCF